MKRLKMLTNSKKSAFLFFRFMFYCLVTRSINTPKSSNDFMVLIISFISLFGINKVNSFLLSQLLFHTFISSFGINKVNYFLLSQVLLHLRIFISNLFISFEVKLLSNPGKLSITKGIATFDSDFFLNCLIKNQKIHLIELY